MEKINIKTASKGNGSEAKSKQDVPHKYLRLPKTKDNSFSRPDPRRKTNVQRNKEPRSCRVGAGAVCERYRSEISEWSLDDQATRHGNRRGNNLNHLLNFTLVPYDSWDGSGRRHSTDYRHSFNRTKLHKYNKELFLQANCQFVARDNVDSSIYQMNPDQLIEWSFIEEIRMPSYESPLCPICLHIPVSAKITRCGHIYCWPCMLHYLALTDKSWQKCPICYEAVHKTDLKSVFLQMRKPYPIQETITMCLMMREQGSLFSTPITREKVPFTICSVDDADCVTRYQKLLIAGQENIQIIINREKNELYAAYEIEKDTPEACFIQSAIEILQEREQKLYSADSTTDVDQNSEIKNENFVKRQHLVSVSSSDSFEEPIHDACGNSLKSPTPSSSPPYAMINHVLSTTAKDERKGMRYFYQSEDGQHIYMHNINVRMLQMEYGSLDMAPPLLSAKIVEIERESMTEVLRKRQKYLQHLPLTCEFQTVELDFSNLVCKATYEKFENEIKKRKMLRSKKAREERRREKMIEVEENKKLGKYPKATYNLSSTDQFPAYNPEDFLSLSPPKVTAPTDENKEFDGITVDDVWNRNVSSDFNANSPPMTSFAQMLKVGNNQAFKSTQKQNPPVSPIPQQPRNQESGDEDCTPAPEYRQSFSDAIQAALDAVTLEEVPGQNQNSKKKKKGKKHQLLFTTSMCRNK